MSRKKSIVRWLMVVGLAYCLTFFYTLAGPAQVLAATEPTQAKEVRFTIEERRYSVNGEERLMDARPFIAEGRTYVPVRYLAEAIGTLVEWESTQQRVTLASPSKNVELFIGRPVVVVNGEEKPIPVAPVVREGRTYLPARFVAESFGYKVGWEPSTRTVIISRTHWQSYRMIETLRIGGIDKLWMPVPREWDGVGMANVKVIDISPQPDDLYEDANGNRIAFWETQGRGSTEYKIVFEVDVSPIEYDIDPSKVGDYDTTSPEYQKYTKPSPWIQSDNEAIVKLAHDIVGSERNPLAQARLLHHWVATNIGFGEVGTAVATLEKRSGDCGGHSFLFVALCRALGIPARPVAGLHTGYQGRFVSGSAQKRTMLGHVWSEFYLPGFGWVQCDTSAGVQNVIGINEPRIVLSRGDEIALGHGFPGDTIAWFHTPQTNANVNIGGTPPTQTWGEELSLTVETR